MVILQDAVPGLKRFVSALDFNSQRCAMITRLVVAFMMHRCRMSASQAGGAIRSDPRHRGQVCRFLSRKFWQSTNILATLYEQLLVLSAPAGTWLFILDQTLCSQQGERTENTYSSGNRQKRPRKGRRYNKYKYARKRCHCFVMGLLISPQGVRIPFSKSYYTEDYCKKKQRPYRRQTELAADLIRELPLPKGVEVIVLGDTAFEALAIRVACQARSYCWIVPLNPERVLEGPKPRPKVRSLVSAFSAGQFTPVRLHPGRGDFVAQRRVSPHRMGPKTKPRTFYVHQERRTVHSVGEVRLVFSTRTRPQKGVPVDVQKILMTNDLTLPVAKIVELYDLRWQIELFFKELKSTLGLHHYRFRKFAPVECWIQMALATFLYLEWHRAVQLRRRDLTKKQKRWWQQQRTYGLCQAIRQTAERNELQFLARQLRTSRGVKKVQTLFENAYAREYRCPI
jgi:hypothetical protein